MYEYTPPPAPYSPASFSWQIPGQDPNYNPAQTYMAANPTAPTGMTGLPAAGGGSSGWFGIDGLGKNIDTLKLGLGGLQTIGNLWAAFQAQNLAKKQFNFTKDITNTNLANQIQSYNTSLADRARSRAAVEGQSAAQSQAYIDQNSLKR